MAQQSGTLKVVGIVAGFIVITGLWCWWWPGWCPICPNCRACAECAACEACEDVAQCCGSCPDGAADAQIIVDDVHTAAWMLTDNEWVDDPGNSDHWVCEAGDLGGSTPTDSDKFGSCKTVNGYAAQENYRPGVLFQTGNILEEAGTYDNLKEVTITTETEGIRTTETLSEEDFDWLDINAKDQPCPIDPLHAYSLFYDDPDDLTPERADLQVELECDGARAVDSANNEIAQRCLRDRGLHARLMANKDVITYWPDPEGLYSIDVTKGADGTYTLTKSTFELCEPVTVDQWNEGCWKQRFEDVVEVRLVYIQDSSNHGGYHDPAMDGGPPRRP